MREECAHAKKNHVHKMKLSTVILCGYSCPHSVVSEE